MQRLILFIALLAVMGGGAYLLYTATQPFNNEQPTPTNGGNGATDTTDWETYTNEEYGFSIMHPGNWQVYEATEDTPEPKFNIYKPGRNENNLPYTHHSTGVTHVSIFPRGIGTEGVFGESQNSSVDFAVDVQSATDFVLSDSTVWATYAGIANPPAPWNEFGFLFAAIAIQNLQIDCIRNGEVIPMNQCDVLPGNDQYIRHGSINEQDRQIQEAMLNSFQLFKPTAK